MKYIYILMALFITSIQAQEMGREIKILDTIKLSMNSDKMIIIDKGDFCLIFDKSKVDIKFQKLIKNEKDFFYKNKSIECYLKTFKNCSKVNLNEIKDVKFHRIFSEIGCDFIENGLVEIIFKGKKLDTIHKLEVYEWDKYSAEKTIQYSDTQNRIFWLGEVLLSEDFED